MDIDALKQQLIVDKSKTTSSYRRYPVRFLFMEMSDNTQNEILNLVKSFDGELLELSDYIMKKDDGWMTKSKFMNVINKHASKTKDTFVVGFSELIRFFSRKEIESTVLSLFDIENSGTMDNNASSRRIYIICFSMMNDVFKVLKNSFPRKDLINPFINDEFEFSGAHREICFVANDYSQNIKTNKISTSVEWLSLWKNSEVIDFSKPIWCCSDSLYSWHCKASPDNAFQIDVICNTKSYLFKTYGLDLLFQYDDKDIHFWETLSEKYSELTPGKSIERFIEVYFSIDSKSSCAVAGKLYTSDNTFDRWLLHLYSTAYLKESYLAKVIRLLKSGSKKEFLSAVWQQGYWTDDHTLFKERKDIIKELNKYSITALPEEDITSVIYKGVANRLGIDYEYVINNKHTMLVEWSEVSGHNLQELRERLLNYYREIFKPAFTGLSKAEKEFIINLYSNDVLNEEEIQDVYPSLYYYLYSAADNLVSGREDIKKYLSSYRFSKVANKDNDYLLTYYLNGSASSESVYSRYYDLPRQESLIEPYENDSDIYVFDGVGAEYLPLLVELLKKNGHDIEYCDLASCHLPTITEINKKHLSNVDYKEWFLDFDQEVIHGEFYKTSVNLRKAFDILETKIKEIVEESFGKRIVITSDHGATARARWTNTKKKYDFSTADHEGRCCKLSSNNEYSDSDDYIVYEDENNPVNRYAISLNDQSLFNKPRYEDHGGATIEEMIVPVIVSIPKGISKKINYKVVPDNLEVSGLNKYVSFAITPDPTDEIYIIEKDGSKQALTKEGLIYKSKLSSGKEQKIKVVIKDVEYEFQTKNKAKQNMEGDDGFDD